MAAVEPGGMLSHYRLVEKIGEGGMGEVWRARDTRLDRDVAIKVLPDAVARDADRLARFEREAKAVAALSHPNILEIHDFDTDGGVTFAVMELLKGESLRDRVSGKPLPLRTVAETGAAIADGLAAAHASGIVHRDLKPENVFLTTDGRVKILDFGLACSEPAASHDTETRTSGGTDPGTVLGTVGYMSPEQVRGAQADTRSDIFSLGCMLYEMATGGRAFSRETAPETMTAILREDPPRPALSGVDPPPELDRIVAHCLEKNPDQRFQSARDLAFDLRSVLETSGDSPALRGPGAGFRQWWLLGAAILFVVLVLTGQWWIGEREQSDAVVGGLDQDRIVVAAFENRTGDPAHDLLGKMAADWITQGLIRVPDLDVLPSMSTLLSRPTEGEDDPIRAVAERTGAGVVVSGAYYLQGESLQFHAAVTDVTAGKLLHSLQPVHGSVSDPMNGIEELSQRVMGLMAAGEERLLMSRPPRYEAYQEYIAGNDAYGRDNARALAHFERAAAADPDFIAPRIWLIYIYEAIERYAESEVVLADLQKRRHTLSPFEVLWLDVQKARREQNYIQMLRLLRKAEKEAPRECMIKHWIGICGLRLNRPRLTVDTYRAVGEELVQAYVMSHYWHQILATALHMLGEHEEELQAARKGIAWFPDDLANRVEEVSALAALGRVAEIEKVIEESLATVPGGEQDVMDVILTGSMELRAHGWQEESIRTANHAVDRLRTNLPAEVDSGKDREDLAVALYHAERWDEAREAYRELSILEPDEIDHHGRLGVLAARLGEDESARQVSRELQALERPYLNGSNTLWRAKIAAVLGERDRAIELVRDAMAQGYTGYFNLHCDIDLEPLRDHPSFVELMTPKD